MPLFHWPCGLSGAGEVTGRMTAWPVEGNGAKGGWIEGGIETNRSEEIGGIVLHSRSSLYMFNPLKLSLRPCLSGL